MQRLPRFLCFFLAAIVVTFDFASAQDLPPLDVLRSIADKLPHRPQRSLGTRFQLSGTRTVDPICGLQPVTMTLAAGSPAARSIPVLLDRVPADATAPVTLMTVLRRVTVDADGSPRTYHPDDPHGTGTCTREAGPNGDVRYAGICALDDFASAHLLVFSGARKLVKGEFETPWRNIWPLIRDRKLTPIDLKQYVPSAPDGYYFFYAKDLNVIALFKREIIPQASDGYPCRHDNGYFVAATTLKQDGAAMPNGCTPSHFIDPEKIPFFVLPDDAFGNARVGDVVVARLAGHLVYGVVGDTGPLGQLGEGSIAFNQALLARSGAIDNDHDVNELDISTGQVTVLVLGGTKSQFNGDYSRENVEAVGRREFARWNGDPSNPTARLDACFRQAAPN
jgi:hypothetical protein